MFQSGSLIRAACVVAFSSMMFVLSVPSSAAGTLPAGTFAVVNGLALPQTQLDTAARAVAARTGQADTPQLRAQIRQGLIVREVLRQAAEKANYGQRPQVQAATVDAETQLYMKENVHPQPVTDAQVKARYDQIVASLGKEEYRPRLISVTDMASAQKVLAALKSGQDFAALAREYSIAPTKTAGGQMPWVSFPVPASEGHTQGLPLPIAQAVSTLPVGAVTPQALQVGNVWVIAKLDAKRPTQVPTFDQAKDAIRQQLQAAALQKAAVDLGVSLLRGATIQQ